MKIAYDHQTFSIQAYGGISRYYARLAENLLLNNEEVKIFSPLYRNNYLVNLPESAVQGYKLDYPTQVKRLAYWFNAVTGKKSLEKWKPDVVHETYFANTTSAPKGCPTVITVHDMIHELFSSDFSVLDITSKKKRAAVERADHIICVSEWTRNDLIRLFDVPREKISVVHSGFEHFERKKDVASKALEIRREYLLFVGFRGGYKNFNSFLQSVAYSKSLKKDFDIIVFGGGVLNKTEKKLIQSLGFDLKQIKQMSGGDEILTQLYANASAFIFPSLYEGFGFPPLEAMAHQCPVVSSNNSCMPEIINDAAEFFDPTSIEKMAEAIENVVYSEEKTASLKLLGSKRLEDFSWKKCSQETLKVYESI